MADIDYTDAGAGPRLTGGQVQRLINIAGAVASVGLIVGVCLWGYRLAVRDVSGIPVIRAVEGPMRVAPDNPGGEVADHQGMAINAVAAIGSAQAMPDEIVLAPGPVQLSDEDVAGLAQLPKAMADMVAANTPGPMPLEAGRTQPFDIMQPAPAPVELAPGEILPPSVMAGAIDPTRLAPSEGSTISEDAVARALAEALGVEFVPSVDTEETLTEVAALAAPEAVGDDQGQGIARSLRPKARPEGVRAQSAAVVQNAAAGSTVSGEIDPATLTPGTRLVQLGAFDTADLARGEWGKLVGRFGDLMSGKAAVVQAAESGGRTFYRLRAHGFAGEDDVRRFCAALVAEDAACIPATVR